MAFIICFLSLLIMMSFFLLLSKIWPQTQYDIRYLEKNKPIGELFRYYKRHWEIRFFNDFRLAIKSKGWKLNNLCVKALQFLNHRFSFYLNSKIFLYFFPLELYFFLFAVDYTYLVGWIVTKLYLRPDICTWPGGFWLNVPSFYGLDQVLHNILKKYNFLLIWKK